MSESMAFIGGVAVAGLAALLLLKGTGNSLPLNLSVAPQAQTPVVATPPQMMPPGQYPYGQPYPPNNPAPVNSNNEQMRVDMERLKMQNERLMVENDQLKAQNQQFQFQVESYNNQARLNAFNAQQQNNQNAAQAQLKPQEPLGIKWSSSGIVWAVGGMALTVGGGIVVAGISALCSPKSRPTRTVQVIHPYNTSTPPLTPVRRAEFLPPSRSVEARRVEAPEYDDMY